MSLPLPNIDFNILPGNSLIGLLRVRDEDFEKKHQKSLFRRSYKDLLAEKNRLIENYRHAAAYTDDLTALRDDIDKKKDAARETLDDILLDEFKALGIKFEQATWDTKKNGEGKSVKRTMTERDIEGLNAFHWGFEFDEILQKRGGFDAIITNPPWEVFKPNGKEFFEEHSDIVSKKNMTIHDFEREQAKLLKDPEIREAWLEYLSDFPHHSAWFRATPQFANQISIVNGKKAGTDINLYKLFVEQCFAKPLRNGGECGIILPTGLYTDLGSKGLRQLIFDHTRQSRYYSDCPTSDSSSKASTTVSKVAILVFRKGGATERFEAAFPDQSTGGNFRP